MIVALDPETPTEALEPFPDGEILSGTHEQAGVTVFEDAERGLTVGLWEQEANESAWLDYGANEFMTLLDGEVVIVEEDRTVAVRPGQTFFLPKGLRCRWTQPGHVLKFFLIHDDGRRVERPEALRTIVVDPAALDDVAPQADGRPAIRDLQLFANEGGNFALSLQEYGPLDFSAEAHPVHEFMHVLSGALEIEDESGSRRFGAGESFLVPLGSAAHWRSAGARVASVRVG